ncbi:hypothetical protein NL108_011144 [Boleophthalmus pectinirostris]|uniref:tumor necrosis factor receptor superfamily member 6 n=1 Tax=Boleophthalmus pectinirostris TaxID=150288 RepID=UPI002431DECB|nr:tumor necrosis factor receptor superfamily member 6 [Boleophthalmus pectinirostris]KAJ0066354.1 hypothetical protein NL108_011144 [Boleophthalmus pectinirostris]
MNGFCFTTLTLFFLLQSIDLIRCLQCNSTQYSRPSKNPTFCCNMCKPGTYMEKRDENTCHIQCVNCTGRRYADTYQASSCKRCSDCETDNMELDSPCNSTHDTSCKCKAGFKCRDSTCTDCIKSTSTTTPSTILRRTTVVPTKPIQDTVWFTIIICLLCFAIILGIVTKSKPLLNWFSHSKQYCKKNLSVPATVFMHDEEEEEDEEASTPVQEMFSKFDQPIEV